MLKMVEYVHKRMREYPRRVIGIDFTMGQGNDTIALASYCDEVYSFDIQQEAIEITRSRLNDEHVHLIHESHEHFDDYVQNFDIGIFNLGYLPAHDHRITTRKQTTMIALQKAIHYMNQVLFIVCYIGHDEGAIEAAAIKDYVSHLDRHRFNVSCYKMLNKPGAPYVIEIEKR